jgi:hypothetical protein
VLIGVDDEFRRPGCLCNQSWGKWGSGPKRRDQPDSTFWIDAEVLNGMFRERDSFAYSGFEGFPAQSLDYMLI